MHAPPPGVRYPGVLDEAADPPPPWWYRAARGLVGVVLGILAFSLITPAVSSGVNWLGWAAAGRPGGFDAFYAAATAFETPIGMVAAHLGLAMLIPISIALVVSLHRVHPRWLNSVQPGFRWRYALAVLLVAVGVQGAVLAVATVGQQVTFQPQEGFWWFLAAILLTAPLQAAAEEYFFRGYLVQAMQSTARVPWLGVVASAAVFALFHGTQNVPLFLDRFAFGILAGLLVVFTGGLEAAIAAHVVNNVMAFTWAGLTSTIADVRATQVIGWTEAGWDVLRYALFTAAAIWVARRMRLATTTPGVPAG